MGVKQVLSKILVGPRSVWALRQRVNRVAPALSNRWDEVLGVGQSWMPLSYGEYYPRSALVYAAIKVRQEAVARVPLTVCRRLGRRGGGQSVGPLSYQRLPGTSASSPDDGEGGQALDLSGAGLATPANQRQAGRRDAVEPVGPDHPVQRLLDSPNPFWTRGDLWRGTETYLGLWGSAYWGLERDEEGRVVEIWPLRSDRMRLIPDAQRYIKGFVYVGQGQQLIAYVPEDILWFHYFNPLDEYAGLSPIAPLRLSADMGLDALRANRSVLKNDSAPGLVVETADTPTDAEIREFYERWESRFRGVERTRRPALLSAGMKATNLGFSPRDMEYIQSLRWSLEDVGRVYGVPKPMMGDIERITFSNFQTARRVFWEDTIVPQLMFYREALQHTLLPRLGDPSLAVEFYLSAVEALQENEGDKAKRRQMYVTTGIMTINEVRTEMNLPPVEWGEEPADRSQ